jgi:hypothetical protein
VSLGSYRAQQPRNMFILQETTTRNKANKETIWKCTRHSSFGAEALVSALTDLTWFNGGELLPEDLAEAERFAEERDLWGVDETAAEVVAEVQATSAREDAEVAEFLRQDAIWVAHQDKYLEGVEAMRRAALPANANSSAADSWKQSAAEAGTAPAAPEPWIVRNVSDIFAPLEPVNYLLEPLDICAGAPTLVAGYGFSGKTVAAQSMAVSIASGQKVWGVYNARQGRVLHIDYEQGFRLTRERYQRLAAGMMLAPQELEGRLHVVPMPQLYLDNPAHEAFLTKQVEGYDMAIVDSLRACGPTIEENDSSVRGLLDMLNRISDKTGCCFIVIHHARKPQRDGASAGGAKMAIRGSGAIFDACASVVILEAEKGKPTKVMHEKARTSGITSDDFLIKVEDQEVDGNPRGGLIVTAESCPMVGSASGAFEALKKRVLVELAIGAATSKSALAVRTTGNVQAKFAAIAQLIEDGKIIETGKRLTLATP